MPQAIPLVISAAASYAAEYAIAGYILSGAASGGFISFVGSVGLSTIGSVVGGLASMAASSLISPKAKAQRTGSGSNSVYPYVDNGVKTSDRNSVGFREIIYGQTRKAGTVVFEKLSSAGNNNNGDSKTGRDSYLHEIIVFATHECQEFVGFYLDDELLDVDSDGWVLNPRYTSNTDTFTPVGMTGYAAACTSASATGSGTSATIYINVAFATAQTVMGAGDLVKIAGFSDSAYNGQFVITSIASASAGAATQVNYTTDSTITTTTISQTNCTLDISAIGYRGTTAYAYVGGGHGLSSADNIFLYDASPDLFNVDEGVVLAVPTSRTFTYTFTGSPSQTSPSGTVERRNGDTECLVNIQGFLGAAGQDVYSSSAVQDLIPDVLVSTDNFKGLCLAYVRFYNSAEFTQSPQLTAEIKGAKVYDPRDGGLAYTSNAALVIMDYLHRKIGENEDSPIGVGLQYNTLANTSDDIDLDSFSDGADICDEQIYLSDGSQAFRYTINGVINLGEQPVDTLSLMIPCIQGAITYYDFKVKIHPAAYEPAIHNIDETWLIGSVSVEIDNDKQNLSNTIRAILNDEAQNYYPDDMPKYQDAAALAEDNNEVLVEDLQLGFVKEVERAQRLSKLYLKQRRQRKMLKLQLNSKGCMVAPYDTVNFSYSRWGWQNRVYKVLTVSEGLLNEGVSVTMREESPSLYDWDASEA